MSRAIFRTCIGCRQVRPKLALVRLVRRGDGLVEPDFSGAAPGRGAYVCPAFACVQAALKAGRLAHAFRGAAEGAPGFLAWAESLKMSESAEQKRR